VENLKNGDESAFDEIYKRTCGHVAFVCSKFCKNKEDKEEIIQDVYTVIFNKREQLIPETFLPYIRKITAYTCSQKYRRESRHKEWTVISDDYLEDLPEVDKSFLPEEYLLNKEARKKLMDVLDSLPPKQHEMVYMHYYAEMTMTEISKVYDCSINNVSKTLQTARNTIKACLEGKVKKHKGKAVALVPLSAIFLAEEAVFATSYISTGVVTVTTGIAVGASTAGTSAGVGVAATATYTKALIATGGIVATGVASATLYLTVLQTYDHQEAEYIYQPQYPIYEQYEPEPVVWEPVIYEYEPYEIEPEPYEPEPEISIEPEPEPIDRTDQILTELASVSNAVELDHILSQFNFELISQIRGSADEVSYFYSTNEGSGDILIGISINDNGSNWRMRFHHFEDAHHPTNIIDLFRFME